MTKAFARVLTINVQTPKSSTHEFVYSCIGTADLHDESLEKSFIAKAEDKHAKNFLALFSVGYGSIIRFLSLNCF